MCKVMKDLVGIEPGPGLYGSWFMVVNLLIYTIIYNGVYNGILEY